MKASHNAPSAMRLRSSAAVSEPTQIQNFLFLDKDDGPRDATRTHPGVLPPLKLTFHFRGVKKLRRKKFCIYAITKQNPAGVPLLVWMFYSLACRGLCLTRPSPGETMG